MSACIIFPNSLSIRNKATPSTIKTGHAHSPPFKMHDGAEHLNNRLITSFLSPLSFLPFILTLKVRPAYSLGHIFINCNRASSVEMLRYRKRQLGDTNARKNCLSLATFTDYFVCPYECPYMSMFDMAVSSAITYLSSEHLLIVHNRKMRQTNKLSERSNMLSITGVMYRVFINIVFFP